MRNAVVIALAASLAACGSGSTPSNASATAQANAPTPAPSPAPAGTVSKAAIANAKFPTAPTLPPADADPAAVMAAQEAASKAAALVYCRRLKTLAGGAPGSQAYGIADARKELSADPQALERCNQQ